MRALHGLRFHLWEADRAEASRLQSRGRAFQRAVMASPLIVEINFQRLLRNICEKFSLPPPRYGITVGSSYQFCAFVDVQVPRCSHFMEVIPCWGSPSTDSSLSKNEAARSAIETLRNELQFDIGDANYTEKNHFNVKKLTELNIMKFYIVQHLASKRINIDDEGKVGNNGKRSQNLNTIENRDIPSNPIGTSNLIGSAQNGNNNIPSEEPTSNIIQSSKSSFEVPQNQGYRAKVVGKDVHTMLDNGIINSRQRAFVLDRHSIQLAIVNAESKCAVLLLSRSGPAEALPVACPDPPYVYTYKASTTTAKIKQEIEQIG
uniref:Uncharacterized protein n=1 Tax=Ananas comosus var. bracteatus TaxID=296719 RepID=A0A6V7NWS7_ANACO|nr:unnamed protein product [Ananas comosus var. bracteatus]